MLVPFQHTAAPLSKTLMPKRLLIGCWQAGVHTRRSRAGRPSEEATRERSSSSSTSRNQEFLPHDVIDVVPVDALQAVGRKAHGDDVWINI